MKLHHCALGLGLAAATALAVSTTAAGAANVIRWASQADALTFDPHAQNEGPTTTATSQVYESLIDRTPTLEKRPGLALSWRTIDPKTWEFKLRQGVKFHDGTPFTSADVVFSFERALSPTSDFKNYINSIESLKAVDPHTVHVLTKGPNPILPDQIASIRIMSKAWSEKHNVTKPQNYKEKEETYAIRNANGTGPFVLKQRDPDVKTVMVRNPDWWGHKANPHNIDEIVYTPIANKATRVAALLSGELDFVLDPPLQDLGRIKATPGLKVSQINQIRTIFYGLNVGARELQGSDVKGKNPLADVRVRQAMAHAIDVDTIKEKVMRGLSFPAGIITSPGVHGFNEKLDARPAYDPAKAKQLLADAGYPNGFSVKLDCPNDRYNNDEAICQATVGMLAKVGVRVNLDAQSKSLHFPKLQKKQTDFYMLGWGVPTLDSHYVFSYLYHSKGSWNPTGYANPKVDELTDKLEVETDLAKRDQMIQQVWDIVKADVVYLPLHHQVIAWGLRDKLELPIVPNDSPQFKFARMK